MNAGQERVSTRGRFITFEGIDGAGKSSHIQPFAQTLRSRGIKVIVTREPGGSELAERLRELILLEPMSPTTEMLLAFAARSDHLDRLIRPAIARGEWVICDRFTDSTFAYQGGGRGLPWDQVAWLERSVHPDLQPDLTLLFELPPEVAAQRRAAARAADRIEREDLGFFERVAAGYRKRVAERPERFLVVDARASMDEISKMLHEYALKCL